MNSNATSCPTGGRTNPESARFCNECGSPLASLCSACQNENPPGSKFCNHCGGSLAGAASPADTTHSAGSEQQPRSYTPKHLADKILQSRSALEGERKQVTVMFADVKGSMELAQQLGPEQWHEVLESFFELLAEGVHRFEGTVNQYTGDGIMALFGAPIAHEDHAQRACHASLYLSDRLREYGERLRADPGIEFSFRIGLNSGEVIVAKIGDDLRMDYTAQGHAVGLAQRMEQLAPPNGITVSEQTQKTVEGLFAFEALGPQTVKGARETVDAFVLASAGAHRTRLDTSRARGLSRLVGRSRELGALEASLEAALGGTGRVAAVVGEAGVGKSRLCAEFVERCREQGLPVFEAHCPAHGKTIPYLPLQELLRNLLEISEQDSPAEARRKIRAVPFLGGDEHADARIADAKLEDAKLEDDRALVFDLLDVADPESPAPQLDPALRQRRLSGFLRRLIRLRTEEEAIVLLIDDLHWVDPGSDFFVAQLVEVVSSARALLLVNYRPEYTAEWLRKSWVMQLPVAPLGAAPLNQLVRDRVGTAPSVEALPALIEQRSGGNPFFAEEILQSLIETRVLVGERGAYELTTTVEAVEVPASVKALLAARIDRLGEREKLVLYAAAAIGKEFARPLLEAVAEVSDASELDHALDSLLRAELIHDRDVYPIVEYGFKHPLTHEVALNAQLTGARRSRHERVARAIEAAEPQRLGERASLLAHHWEEAGDPMRAATWHVRAARRVSRSDMSATFEHWSQARRLLSALPHSEERSQLLLDVYPELLITLDCRGAEPAEAASVYREALDVSQLARNQRAAALLEAAYAQLVSSQSDFEAMERHARRALALAEEQGDLPARLLAGYFLARSFSWQTRWQESIPIYNENIAAGGGEAAAAIEVLGWHPYVDSHSTRSAVLSILGRPRESLEFIEAFPGLLLRAGAGADLSSAASDQFWACWSLGDADRARSCSEQALRLAERFGADRHVVYALLASGNAATLGERWQDGKDLSERAQELISSTGAGAEWGEIIDGHHVLCLAALGEHEQVGGLARDYFGQEESLFVNSFFVFLWARALRMAGNRSHQREVEARIDLGLDEVEIRGCWFFAPFLLLERAALARLRGDVDGMAKDLGEARRLFAQMGVTGWDDYARSIEGGS